MPAAPKIPNDHISESLENILGALPERFKNSDEYLDVISWNLRWFNHKDPEKVKNIGEVLTYLNADIFIFQEVQDESLEILAETLRKNDAGTYLIHYGTTGGDQRIAFMYDTEWVRAKDDVVELFGKGTVKTGDNKDVFPRLPLYGYFLAKSPNLAQAGFTVQFVGVHLKSQVGGGGSQRMIAAEKLAWWLTKEANDVDSDTVIIGDWNKKPSDNDWQAIHDLERNGIVEFESINDESEFSHLYYENKQKMGSRLDIALMTRSAALLMPEKQTEVVRWITIDDLLKSANEMTVKKIKSILDEIKLKVSDHMPLYARYYVVDKPIPAAKKKAAAKKVARKKAAKKK